jgi:hypothetical protein
LRLSTSGKYVVSTTAARYPGNTACRSSMTLLTSVEYEAPCELGKNEKSMRSGRGRPRVNMKYIERYTQNNDLCPFSTG